MRIGIIGAGNVGAALGAGWAARGHAVRFARRDPAAGLPGGVSGGDVGIGTNAEVAAFAEVVVLATPWGATQAALAAAGNLAGKVLVDCTNPIGPGLVLTHGHTTSGGEQVAAWAPGARVVKCFNTIGAEHMAHPGAGASQPSLFACGDDAEAKGVALRLGAELGFDMVDAGPLAQARLTEPLAMLWITLALKYGMGRGIAFRLVRG